MTTPKSKSDGDDASTILRARPDAPAPVESVFEVTVVAGPDEGASVRLDGTQASRVLVGSSEACTLRLRDREVSRRHIAFDSAGARLRVTDLDSKNGTVVNDVAVADAYLRGGETVRIGATALLVALVPSSVSRDLDKNVAHASTSPSSEMRFGRVVGASPAMRRLYPLCKRLAASAVPVILEGETGTGKELLAEALHDEGARASGPFVVFDCSAVPPQSIESELFGVEGAGADATTRSRKGVFEQADGGTLLIDEIGDLDIALQPKLLRAIERSEIRRLGGGHAIHVNTRILVATRRNLDKEVQAGRFREDLFFRLAVARIELPRLHDRAGDVGVLARHFHRQLDGVGVLDASTLARFEDYAWPGNVRELRNAVARRIALGELDDEGGVGAGTKPEATAHRSASKSAGEGATFLDAILALNLPMPLARQKMTEEFERRYMAHILARYGGNVAQAAAASGLARRYFQLLRARHPA